MYKRQADTGDTLYVDRTNPACSDQGSGTSGQPYCTPSAAAAVVNPGQTVLLNGAGYPGHLTITRSGTPDKPIVFTSSLPGQHRARTTIGSDASVPGPAITISGAHDVVVQDIRTTSVAEGILVDGSSRITLDHNFDRGLPPAPGTLSHAPGIRLTNGTSATTISRNIVVVRGTGIVLDAGTHDNVVTTNGLVANNDGGVSATDAPGTVLTSNTLTDRCSPEIYLAGASTGSTVENNILFPTSACSGQSKPTASGDGNTVLVVSAGSAGGARADYNTVRPAVSGTGYNWAGTAYPGPAEFSAATGQGRHDSSADPKLTGWSPSPAPGSPAIASADPSAPGELDSDLNRTPPVNDPSHPNPATGPAYRDRGAVSHQGLYGAGLEVDQNYGTYPFKVTATAGASDLWTSATLSFTFDFGDGSAPVVSATPKAGHTYQARGSYQPMVTVTDSFGSRISTTSAPPVTVNEPGPPHADLSVKPWTDNYGTTHVLSYQAVTDGSTSPWPLVSKTVDFGDGTAAQDCYTYPLCIHTYAQPGNHTVTLTVKDSTGATDSTTAILNASYQPAGLDVDWARRVLDTRNGTGAPKQQLGPDSELTLDIIPPNNTTADATAVVLNLTTVNPTEAGFLTVYPSGQSRPGTSNSNFVAGQTVAHLVTVPIGSDGNVKIYNHSGSLDVVADIVGLYRPSQSNGFTAITPARVLDTRNGHGKVGPRGQVCFPMPSSVPDGAQVVLNVTATGADQGTYLTQSPYWGSSILNFGPGQTVANQTVAGTANRTACLYNWAGNTDIVVDVTGYYAQNTGAHFTPVTPARLLDTRTGSGTPLAPGSVTGLQITGRGSVPAGATGAVLNLTATRPELPGYLTVYPSNGTRPGTSSVNFAAGQTVPNHITTGLGPDGRIDLYNFRGNTDAIADIFGYFK